MILRALARGLRLSPIVVCLIASHAWGQEPPSREQPAVTEPLPIPPTVPGPAISAYPAELLRLWMPQRGPVTLTPSISVSEEYNHNIFVTDRNHQWNFVTNFSPGITLTVNRPTYQLSAGYTFSGQIYAREESLNSVFERQYFLFAGLYQVTP